MELAVVEPQRLQSGVVERAEVMRGNLFCTWATQSAHVQGSTSGTGSYTPEGLYPNLESGDPAGSLSGVEIITASSVPEVDACGGGRVLKEAVG